MNMKHVKIMSKLSMALLTSVLALFSSCGPKDNSGGNGNGGGGNSGVTGIHVANNPETIDFTDQAETREVKIVSSSDAWRVREKEDVSWLEVARQGSRAIKMVVETNTADAERTATIVLVSDVGSKEYKVRQMGSTPTVMVNKTVVQLPASGGPIDFTVTSNVEVTLQVPDWVTINTSRAAMIETSHSYTASPNKGETARSGYIEVLEKNPPTSREAKKQRIAISQVGLSGYTSYGADNITEDIKLKIASGDATSHQAPDDITKAFDDNIQTIWHSRWDNSPANYWPITVNLNFDQPQDVDYMIYTPRQVGVNGHFKVVDILSSVDGQTYTPVMTKDFGGVGTPTRVNFATPIRAKSFRLIVRSGYGDRAGFAAAAEIAFYQKNKHAFDWKTLFTDASCSQLKSTVTEADIHKIQDVFFRNMAFFMLQDKYNREFRVAEYKAYPNPYNHLKTNKMAYAYSMLDNPTGISVNAGETLIVFVGNTHGHEGLAIRVIDYHQNGTGDGIYNPRNYALVEGVNKIKMSTKGLVYVLYNTETIPQAEAKQPIKIHFASGSVNGYFDTQNPSHTGRWKDLLNKAVHPYFDLVGVKAHMTFPVTTFKDATPDGKELIDLFDAIVNAEQELHGLVRYNRMFPNRQHLVPTYQAGAHMYATNEHTAYAPGTLSAVASVSNLKRGGGSWGPAHEIGHIHQTKPGLLWKGTTECTVNIPSAYVQTTLLNQECRLSIENIHSNMNRYTMGFTSLLAKKISHAQEGDVFRKLIPFWQLHLYFGKVLGNSPEKLPNKGGFYPDVYEYLRTNPDVSGHGENQAEFAFVASKVSGYDLTDFFEDWGFLKPVNMEVDDYGKAPLVLTAERAAAVRKRIKDLNLPKPPVALKYITDKTAELFRTNPRVIRGTAERSVNKITLKDWRNVVAYEVLDANGQVVFIGDGIDTDGSTYANHQVLNLAAASVVWTNGFTVRAVSTTGEYTEVVF